MKILIAILTLLFGSMIPGLSQRNLTKGYLRSKSDGNTQVFYYYKTSKMKKQPLVVQLHSWSFPADSLRTEGLSQVAIGKDYNYIFPDFRGVNNHIKACCSEYAIADIDEAIDWALANLPVDKKKIYVAGFSGGGFATLSMYMRSKHQIAAFSAWASISDLSVWYEQGMERKNKYPAEIVKCTNETDSFDTLKAKERSPLFFKTPVKKRKNAALQIFAGIHDGHTGSVPISHSILFYNKVLTDFNEPDKGKYVSEADLEVMIKTQKFESPNIQGKIGNRTVHYKKASRGIQLTVFEGGHEMLSDAVIDLIENALVKTNR
jgi:predicted peptidase